MLTTQRAALRALGTSARPAASWDAAALQRAAVAGELLDAGGLGSHGWLLQAVGTAMPQALEALS